MRLPLFIAFFAALLGISSLVAPIRYGPRPIEGGVPDDIGALPKCLRLRYEAPLHHESPTEIRLRAQPGLGKGLFAADGGPQTIRRYNTASWRPAGNDSIDIGWHHSPVIRLPVSGDSLVGHAEWAGVAPAWMILGHRDYRVVAYPISCSTFVVPAS